MDLPLIWGIIIAFGIMMYVILDGFDLGLGILFPWIRGREQQDIVMTTIAPVWDGNETWLVLNGTALFGAFPLAYSILLPALYVPLLLMLSALVFRGVAFEFRFKAERSRMLWDIAFAGGSTVAAFLQGVVLGAFVQGLAIEQGKFVGGLYDWLTPFSIMTGIGLMVGYALLGATWLIMKTVGELQQWSYQAARLLLIGVLFFVGLVSLWTPFAQPDIAERWFSWPNIAYLSPVPVLTGILALYLWYCLRRRREFAPFLLSITLFLLSYIGLGISIWPYIVPRSITLWQAAAQSETQVFLLVGVAIILPIILTYTAFGYKVFWGKVSKAEHYH